MLASFEESYTQYLQQTLLSDGGVDMDIVRSVLERIGYSDKQIGRILGDTVAMPSGVSDSSSSFGTCSPPTPVSPVHDQGQLSQQKLSAESVPTASFSVSQLHHNSQLTPTTQVPKSNEAHGCPGAGLRTSSTFLLFNDKDAASVARHQAYTEHMSAVQELLERWRRQFGSTRTDYKTVCQLTTSPQELSDGASTSELQTITTSSATTGACESLSSSACTIIVEDDLYDCPFSERLLYEEEEECDEWEEAPHRHGARSLFSDSRECVVDGNDDLIAGDNYHRHFSRHRSCTGKNRRRQRFVRAATRAAPMRTPYTQQVHTAVAANTFAAAVARTGDYSSCEVLTGRSINREPVGRPLVRAAMLHSLPLSAQHRQSTARAAANPRTPSMRQPFAAARVLRGGAPQLPSTLEAQRKTDTVRLGTEYRNYWERSKRQSERRRAAEQQQRRMRMRRSPEW